MCNKIRLLTIFIKLFVISNSEQSTFKFSLSIIHSLPKCKKHELFTNKIKGTDMNTINQNSQELKLYKWCCPEWR